MSELKKDLHKIIVTTAKFGGYEYERAEQLAKVLVPMITSRVFSHKPPFKSNSRSTKDGE